MVSERLGGELERDKQKMWAARTGMGYGEDRAASQRPGWTHRLTKSVGNRRDDLDCVIDPSLPPLGYKKGGRTFLHTRHDSLDCLDRVSPRHQPASPLSYCR